MVACVHVNVWVYACVCTYYRVSVVCGCVRLCVASKKRVIKEGEMVQVKQLMKRKGYPKNIPILRMRLSWKVFGLHRKWKFDPFCRVCRSED